MLSAIHKLKLLSVLLFLLVLPAAFASMDGGEKVPVDVHIDGIDEALAGHIGEFVVETMQELHGPGVAVGIVKDGKLVYQGYFGYADIESGKLVASETMFRIGSISKTMTSIGLMQQWEKGRLDLDDDVNKYLPKLYLEPPHPDTKPITFRHLFTHTSGIGEFLNYRQLTRKWLGLVVEGDNYLPLEHYLADGAKTEIDPGVKWAYSNYGFGYLGLALETIAGEPFHEYEEKNVFEPLGMKRTSFRHNDDILKDLATGYRWENERYRVDIHKAYGITASGNVYSNVEEMSVYMIALLNGGSNEHGSVIKPDTLSEMTRIQYSLDTRQSGWGLGFNIYSNDLWGHRIVGHSGSVPFGHTAQMLLAPNDGIGVIVLTNSWTYSAKPIGWGVLKRMLGVENAATVEFEPDRSVWPELKGYYGPEHKDLKTDMRLYMKAVGKYRVAVMDGKLVLIETWKGPGKARELTQVRPDDPYFFRVRDDESPVPVYVSFKKKNGRMYLIKSGLNEYRELGPARTLKTKINAVPGRALSKLIP